MPTTVPTIHEGTKQLSALPSALAFLPSGLNTELAGRFLGQSLHHFANALFLLILDKQN